MAGQGDIEETYNFMDQVVRASFGGYSDVSCAMYNGDWSKTLEQAQADKHTYVLDALDVGSGSRVLDIGCGWGPILKAVEARGGTATGITLSSKQVESCTRDGLHARLKDWRDIDPKSFGRFDAIVSIGAFEHFCSPQEFEAGEQDHIYERFFNLCHELLVDGGRLYLQTMLFGKNAHDPHLATRQAPMGSDQYVLAVVGEFFPGSFLPFGEEHVLRVARPYFSLVSDNNGRLDYIHTIEEWSRRWNFTLSNLKPGYFSFRKLAAMARLVPRFATDTAFRKRMEMLRKGYDLEAFRRELIDHQRLVLARVRAPVKGERDVEHVAERVG